ncbi:MAG: hypothetical protein AB7P00_40115 [Sandaracinaceae bacterium]
MEELRTIAEGAWLYGAAPATLLAGIFLTVRLGVPQVAWLGRAFRAVSSHDAGAPGELHPAAATMFAAAASYGAAGAVGAGTAVALGGPGAIAWVWLFTLLLMPLRAASIALARSAPPGRAGEAQGSLAGRLALDSAPLVRGIGWALVGLVPLVGLAFVGGVHGGALADVSAQLIDDGAAPVTAIVAGLGLVLAFLPPRRVAGFLGWVAVIAFLTIFAAGLIAFLSEAGRGFGAIGRAVVDAVEDAPSAASFSGALAGEIAVAAMLYLLPPVVGSAGVASAPHAAAQAHTTRDQAAAGMLGPLLYGVLSTLLGLSFVATNAFAHPVEGSRRLDEVVFYATEFDTVSQRLEPDRRLPTAILRPMNGETGVVVVHAGTERGMIRSPSFRDRGEPANVAIRVVDGIANEVQRPGAMGALEAAPPSALREVTIEGEMLPRGARLVAASTARAAGDVLTKATLAALLLLGALAVMAWGRGIRATLEGRVPPAAAAAGAALPAVGVCIAAFVDELDVLTPIGLILAAAVSILVALAAIVRAGEVRGLLVTAKSAAAPVATTKPAERPAARAKAKKTKHRKSA